MLNFHSKDYENTFEALVGYLQSLPKDNVKVLNIEKYKLMLKVTAELKDLLCKTVTNGCIDVDIDQGFNLGSISIELPEFCIYEPSDFAKIIAFADNFEIYPLTNGNIKLNITFQSVLKSIN